MECFTFVKAEWGIDRMSRKRNEYTPARRQQFKKLGLRISYFRKYRDMSQDDLAEAIGFSVSHLAKIEANTGKTIYKPSMDFLFDVAEALDVPPSVLLEDELPRVPKKVRR